MRSGERRLHSLEKIVAIGALAGVLFVSIGFAHADDGPRLRSAVALVLDAASGETLYAKNSEIILPIASITKLMTAIVVLERGAVAELGTHDELLAKRGRYAELMSHQSDGVF